LKELQDHARTLDVIVRPLALRDPDEIDQVFAALPTDTNGLLFENSVINLLASERICALGAQRTLPTVGTFPEFVHSGCLMSYGETCSPYIGEQLVMPTRSSEVLTLATCLFNKPPSSSSSSTCEPPKRLV
jgi:hypothetical protein